MKLLVNSIDIQYSELRVEYSVRQDLVWTHDIKTGNAGVTIDSSRAAWSVSVVCPQLPIKFYSRVPVEIVGDNGVTIFKSCEKGAMLNFVDADAEDIYTKGLVFKHVFEDDKPAVVAIHGRRVHVKPAPTPATSQHRQRGDNDEE